MDLNFIEALTQFRKNQRNESAPRPFSVAVSSWSSTADPDFPFAADIAAEGVTTEDAVDVDFNKNTIKAACAASVVTGETASGVIKLLADKIPEMELSGVYKIIKGAVE